MPDVPVPPDGGQVLPAVSNLELVVRLRKSGCSGVLWLQTVDRLVGYGVGTLHRLLLDGSINAKLARLGRPVQLSAAELEHLAASQEERDDLVRDAVFTGLVLFRDRGIADGTWSPERGADLMTYFVNACLLALPNIVGSWRTRRARTPPIVPHHVELESFAMAGDDPSLRALDDAALDALLASLPPQIARVARTVACDGITWAAACRRHSVSPRMVEGHLRRLRRSQLPRSEDVR
jgi:hypothetical protein